MSEPFDVIILGAGPGGYVCAIRCAQLGMKVAVVEKHRNLGGTCLNVGCIPSKALLHVAEHFHLARTQYARMGIMDTTMDATARIDVARMMAYKKQVVEANTRGIAYLFKKNGITHIQGTGRFISPDVIEVRAPGAEKRLVSASAVVIATGSAPATLPGVEFDEEVILSSTGALALKEVPGRLVVIGGGVIGLELGALWARLGADVTIIEYEERLLAGWDADVAKTLARELKKQGLSISTSVRVAGLRREKDKAVLEIEPRDGGAAQTLPADKALIAIGRRPYTEGLKLERIGVHADEKGFIRVNARFETARAGVYAIGDVIGPPMLAHKAEEEGLALAELLAGQSPMQVDYALIPSVLYTEPEAASIGFTEEELRDSGIDCRVGTFRFLANGRARAMNATAGFVKLLAHAETGRLLGAHVLGPMAGELIHEIAVAMRAGLTARELAHVCHAHPTLAEAVREAAMAVVDKPLHA